jgi:hypothetical protein
MLSAVIFLTSTSTSALRPNFVFLVEVGYLVYGSNRLRRLNLKPLAVVIMNLSFVYHSRVRRYWVGGKPTDMPPSTGTEAPVMKDAASEARKTATLAT